MLDRIEARGGGNVCDQPVHAPDILDQDGGEPAPRLELAALYFARGQYETALDEIKLALVARPDLAAAFNLRGLIYAAQGSSIASRSQARNKPLSRMCS